MDNDETYAPVTREYPVLIALQGPLEGRRWTIKGPVIIGRDAGCTITIEDRQVSRQHARVRLSGNECVVEDLGSKNGTFTGGEKVEEPVSLHDGDVFQIALIQKFAFFSTDATMPIEDLNPALFRSQGRLVVDAKSRRVWILGREINPPLSAAQFRLLNCLYEQSGKVVSRDELIQRTWEEDDAYGVSDQALDALIRRLRDRLAELDDHPYIITVRGHGTRLDNPDNKLNL